MLHTWEIAALVAIFVTLVVLGPLVRLTGLAPQPPKPGTARIGLADFPT